MMRPVIIRMVVACGCLIRIHLTPAGVAIDQRHEVHTYIKIPKNDRLQWGGNTYDVELDPESVCYNNDDVYFDFCIKDLVPYN